MFNSFEQITKNEEPLKKAETLKSESAFTWPMSSSRQRAIKMIESGEINKREVLKFLHSDDFIEQRAGLYLFNQGGKFSDKTCQKVQFLVKGLRPKDYETRKIFIESRVKVIKCTQSKEKAAAVLEKMKDLKQYQYFDLEQIAAKIEVRMLIEDKGERRSRF